MIYFYKQSDYALSYIQTAALADPVTSRGGVFFTTCI